MRMLEERVDPDAGCVGYDEFPGGGDVYTSDSTRATQGSVIPRREEVGLCPAGSYWDGTMKSYVFRPVNFLDADGHSMSFDKSKPHDNEVFYVYKDPQVKAKVKFVLWEIGDNSLCSSNERPIFYYECSYGQCEKACLSDPKCVGYDEYPGGGDVFTSDESRATRGSVAPSGMDEMVICPDGSYWHNTMKGYVWRMATLTYIGDNSLISSSEPGRSVWYYACQPNECEAKCLNDPSCVGYDEYSGGGDVYTSNQSLATHGSDPPISRADMGLAPAGSYWHGSMKGYVWRLAAL